MQLGLHRHPHRVLVVERPGDQRPVFPRRGPVALRRADRPKHPVMGEQHALGPAGRPGRVRQERDLTRRDRRRLEPAGVGLRERGFIVFPAGRRGRGRKGAAQAPPSPAMASIPGCAPGEITAALQAESPTTKRIVSAPSRILSGTGTSPARIAPKNASMNSNRFVMASRTRSPGARPRPASGAAATRSIRMSSSPCVISAAGDRDRSTIAVRPGWAAAAARLK